MKNILNRSWFNLAPITLLAFAPAASANLITNGNFASVSPALSRNGVCTTDRAAYPAVDPGYYPACSAAGWTGTYQIGNGATVGYGGVSFGIPQPDPGGGNALILQAEHNLAPTATQAISVPTSGLYTLTFYAANRSTPAVDAGPQTVSVLLDNTVIPGGTYAKPPAAWTLETVTFSVTAGSHSLTFEGLDETSGATSANVAAFVDDISLVPEFTPAITAHGIVPVYSTATTIQPGSWISIFGTSLASAPSTWNGDFPEMLGGTTVTINSKPAYLWFVSPTQINLQAPDDTATGTVDVVVTTAVGSTTSTVTLEPYAPSFSMYNGKYVAAIVPTPGEPGNSGDGYDYIGPGGSGLSFSSRPVKAGETVLLYGVGFGPTKTPVPAGAAFSGAESVPVLPTVTIGGVPATVTFAGIVEAGLFQLNVVVPSAASGDQALVASIGGVTTPVNVLLSLQ